jgi:hypothetical protein
LPPKAKITAEVCSGTKPPEIQIALGPLEVETGQGQLEGDDHADQKADDTPGRPPNPILPSGNEGDRLNNKIALGLG